MKKPDKKFRPGKKVLEFDPYLPCCLKRPPKYNILIGEDEPQQRFAEQSPDVPCVFMEGVVDEDLLTEDSPKLFRVESSRLVVLSPQVKETVVLVTRPP